MSGLEQIWHKGEPPKPWRDEWFIAVTSTGEKVVLISLPEEYSYDYKTADQTYFKASMIAKWMQFPDSEFIAPDLPPTVAEAMRCPDVAALVRQAERMHDLACGDYTTEEWEVATFELRALLAAMEQEAGR